MKWLTVCFLAFSLAFVGCAAKQGVTNPAEKPDVFCQVEQPPNPLLMGTWEGAFRQRGEEFPSYIKYTLVKYQDNYAINFFRSWKQGRKRNSGWRSWIVNENQITGLPRKFGVRIFVKGQDVYFIMRDMDKPVKMTRVSS